MTYLTILDLGFFNTAIRYIAKYKAKQDWDGLHGLIGMLLVIYSAISLVVLILSTILYFNIELVFGRAMTGAECETIRRCLVVVSINVALTFPLSVFKAAAIAYERYLFQRSMEVIRVIANFVLTIAVLLMGCRVYSLVIVTSVCNVVVLVAMMAYAFRSMRIRVVFHSWNRDMLNGIVSFSVLMFIVAMSSKLYWNSGQFILGAFGGASQVGLFSVGVQLSLMFAAICAGLISVFLPYVTRISIVDNSEKEISDLFIKVSRIQFFIATYIMAGFIVLGREFLKLWLGGSDSGEIYVISLILMVAIYIPNIQGLGNTILEARNHMKFRAIVYVSVALIAIVLQSLFSVEWGVIGCAVATLVAISLGMVIAMNIYWAKRERLNIKLFFFEILKMFPVFVVYSIAMHLILNVAISVNGMSGFFLKSALFSVGYLICMLLLMEKAEKSMLMSMVSRVVPRRKPIINGSV
jgi:O-antigen/teichoic acid export membrane protein